MFEHMLFLLPTNLLQGGHTEGSSNSKVQYRFLSDLLGGSSLVDKAEEFGSVLNGFQPDIIILQDYSTGPIEGYFGFKGNSFNKTCDILEKVE